MGALKRIFLIITVFILSLSLSLDTGYCKPGKEKKDKKDKKEHVQKDKNIGKKNNKYLARIERYLVPTASSSAIEDNSIEDVTEDETTAGIKETLSKLSELRSGKQTDINKPGTPASKPKAKSQASTSSPEYPSF